MKKKIGIIGKGHVGAALHQGLERAGYEVKITGKGDAVRTTAAWAEILILTVPYSALDAALAAMGNAVDGKVLVDARVVKAFNTIFAQNMSTGKVRQERLACLAASDDEKAKADVLEMAGAIGFDALDAGPLANAPWLESMGFLNIQLGYLINNGLGAGIGFALIR